MWLRSTTRLGRGLLGHRLAQAGFDRVEVVGDLAELHDVPAVALEALRDVVAVRELGRAVDRDVVVVVDVHEPAEAEVAGERRGLVADALLEVSRRWQIANTWWSQTSAPNRARRFASASAMPTPFAKPWPSGPVVTSTPAVWPYSGWPGRARAPLPELRGGRRARGRSR